MARTLLIECTITEYRERCTRLMCDSSPTPLARLSQQCAACLHRQGQAARLRANCEPCRELAYRALCDGNDAAWDLLLMHLWPLLLRWLYAAQPELTPTVAEGMGYRVLWKFRDHCAQRADLAATFPILLATLRQCLHQVIDEGAG